MNSERQAIEQLRDKLMGLGYPEFSLKMDVKTPYGKIIDLVAYDLDKPKIVFEVKVGKQFSTSLQSIEFRFNPVVRQAQSLSQDIKAPYFAVFTGEEIYWFDLDEKNGHPRLLSTPVLLSKGSPDFDATKYSRNQILRTLFELGDIGRGNFDSQEIMTHAGLAVLARLKAEAGNRELENLLIASHPELELLDERFADVDVTKNEANKYFYPKALNILDKITLSHLPSQDFIEAIDEFIQFFISREPYHYLRLPFWLTEFMASLFQVNPHDSVLDIYSHFGDGLVAIHRLEQSANIYSIVSNSYYFVWENIKRSLLQVSQDDFLAVKKTPEYDDIKYKEKFHHILVSPPFGGRIKSNDGFTRIEDIALKSALEFAKPGGRIVAIVPENLLFAKSRQNLKQLILQKAFVRAIFSLEQFSPGTSIKASILVIEKKSQDSAPRKIMMGKILNKDIQELSGFRKSILKNAKIQRLLAIFAKYIQYEEIINDKQAWFIPSEKLSVELSWSVDSYDPSTPLEITSQYPVLHLGKIAELRKGSPLTLDKLGDIFVIGPSALRALSIDPTKLDKTSSDKIPPEPILTRIHDILIHAIGNYRGETAIIEPGFENFYVSRNIIVLRNITPNIIPSYLAIALNSSFVKKQLEDRATGSVISILTARKLKDVLIPVPDLQTQKEIVQMVFSTRQKILEIEQQVIFIESARKEEENKLQALLNNIHLGGGENA